MNCTKVFCRDDAQDIRMLIANSDLKRVQHLHHAHMSVCLLKRAAVDCLTGESKQRKPWRFDGSRFIWSPPTEEGRAAQRQVWDRVVEAEDNEPKFVPHLNLWGQDWTVNLSKKGAGIQGEGEPLQENGTLLNQELDGVFCDVGWIIPLHTKLCIAVMDFDRHEKEEKPEERHAKFCVVVQWANWRTEAGEDVYEWRIIQRHEPPMRSRSDYFDTLITPEEVSVSRGDIVRTKHQTLVSLETGVLRKGTGRRLATVPVGCTMSVNNVELVELVEFEAVAEVCRLPKIDRRHSLTSRDWEPPAEEGDEG